MKSLKFDWFLSNRPNLGSLMSALKSTTLERARLGLVEEDISEQSYFETLKEEFILDVKLLLISYVNENHRKSVEEIVDSCT